VHALQGIEIERPLRIRQLFFLLQYFLLGRHR
jgi:hypothetical protein